MILGEGAGIVVLEAAGRAAARGARALAVLKGAAMNSDAGDLVNPDASGMSGAMAAAIADAGVAATAIDYINAHGTGTKANDVAESAAIVQVFGANSGISVSSTKPLTGHALGASGGWSSWPPLRPSRPGSYRQRSTICRPTRLSHRCDPERPAIASNRRCALQLVRVRWPQRVALRRPSRRLKRRTGPRH